MQDSMSAWFVAVAAVLLGGCSSTPSDSDTPPDSSAAAGAAAVNAYAPCKGTLSGAASGAFTCETHALFFLPAYDTAELRGKSEVTLVSSTHLDQGMSPPGIASIAWAGVFA